MIVEMLHYNEIAQALGQIVQATALLKADGGGSDTVQISPSRLLDSPGQSLRLREGERVSEPYQIAAVPEPGVLQLDREVSGSWRVEHGAGVQLAGGLSERLQWVGQGRPELMPEPRCRQLPAVVIEPTGMKQPDHSGSNRTYLQEYRLQVYLLRRRGEGEAGQWALLQDTEQLFNLLMSDPTLHESCWHAQVTEVDIRPSVSGKLQERHPEVQVVRMEVVGRRWENWAGG